MRPSRSAAVFAFVVLLCLTQVGWWIYFQFRETGRLEDVATLLAAGDVAGATHALGADGVDDLAAHLRGRRLMFASEGAVLGLCVLVGVVFFYTAWMRERRVRRQQERFLTGATHELKTPLATVRLGLESLLDARTPPARSQHYLQVMVGEIDRLERGVTNLLTAAGLRQRGADLRLEIVDPATELEAELAAFAPRCEASGITLDCRLASGVRVARDAQALQTIVRNLLDNAVKYSPAGGTVRVIWQRSGDRAELRVSDTGAGMSDDERRRAFDPFYRGPDKAHIGGSGLGLYLVAELARAQGGTVAVASDGPGRGSTFVVSLPLAEPRP